MSGFAQWVVLAALLIAAAPAAGDDWRQVHHDGSRQGRSTDEVRGPYELRWVAEFPSETLATCVEAIVAGDRVFVGTLQGTLWCLDGSSGEVIWKHAADGPILHSPACSDDLVIAGDVGGTLWSLDQTDGKIVWKFASGKGGFSASPLVTSDGVYIGSRDGKLYGLSLTGELRFEVPTSGPIRCTAARVEDRILFASDDMHAYAVDAQTGKLQWRSPKLSGQSFRDYYPVALPNGRVMLRSVLVEELNDELNEGTQLLQRLADIPAGWKPLDEFLKSKQNLGDEQKISAEQDAMLARLKTNPFRRTCFVLDAATGKEAVQTPIWYLAGNGGCGIPPVVAADGRTLALYRTVYSNWSLGVKPCVGMGSLDLATGRLTPLRHRNGNSPPWNTFWGTSDESTNLSIGGNRLYFTHQGTLSSLDLETLELSPVWGNRDTWGGFQTPIWAANEWHGPARGSVAIAGDELFWVTGSRVLCIRGNLQRQPAEPAKVTTPRLSDIRFTANIKPLDVDRLIDEPIKSPAFAMKRRLNFELEREVTELLDGAPWAPMYLQMGIGSRDFFFAHPSFELQALAQAYPHLPDNLARRVQLRGADLLSSCLQADSLPLDQGRRRELFDVPPHDLSWSFLPRWPIISHVQAIWLYGERTGDWEAVERLWPKIRELGEAYLQRPLQIDDQQGSHLWLNRTLVGCVAYARLAKRFRDDQQASAAREETKRLGSLLLAEYRRRAAIAAGLLSQATSGGDTHHNQGRKLYFHLNNHKSKLALLLDLSPELGRELAAAAPGETEVLRTFFTLLMPTYYLAWEERNVHYGENFVDLPDSLHGIFLAHAHLWDADAQTLDRHTDLPWCRGDLFHIERLALAMAASR